MATHSSVLAWRIPGTGEPGGLPSLGSQSRTRLKRLSSSSSVITRLLIRDGGHLETQRGAVGMEAEAGAVPLLALELEEGAAAQEGRGL